MATRAESTQYFSALRVWGEGRIAANQSGMDGMLDVIKTTRSRGQLLEARLKTASIHSGLGG
jgi:hypothetical protein